MRYGKVYDTHGYCRGIEICKGCMHTIYKEWEESLDGDHYWCPTAVCRVDEDRSVSCEHYAPRMKIERPTQRNDCRKIEDFV